MLYAGWVPSVLGRLSFTTYRNELTGSSPSDRPDWIFELEVRDLLDTIAIIPPSSRAGKFFREHIAQSLFGISGRFLFSFIAEYNESDDELVGAVHVVSECLNPSVVKSLKDVLASDIDGYSAANSFLDAGLSEISNGRGHWTAGVTIHRTGKILIDTSSHTRLSETRHEDQLVAEQIYYFIKDLFHNHQHHDPRSDSIITVHRVSDTQDVAWIDSVHHALFRSIIRYKRYQTENHISKSLGILAYTEAFERTFQEDHKAKNFNTTQLKDSLAVALDEARCMRRDRAALAESIKTTFFAFFAFLVSMTFMLRFSENPEISVDKTIFEIARFMMENFWPSFALVGAIAVMIGFWTNSIDPGQLDIVRGLTRAFQGLRLRYFVIVNLVITILLVSIGWYLLFGNT